MTDVTEDRDQDVAELSVADEQLPGGPKTLLSQPDQPTPPKGHPAWAVGGGRWAVGGGRWAEYQVSRAHLGAHRYLFRINPVKRRDFPVNVGIRC